jgi:hypothetical protein
MKMLAAQEWFSNIARVVLACRLVELARFQRQTLVIHNFFSFLIIVGSPTVTIFSEESPISFLYSEL